MIRATTYNTPTGSVTTTTNGGGFSDVVMDLLGRALIAVVAGGFRVIWWAVLFPVISVPVSLAAAVGWFYGWPFGAGVVGVTVAGMVLWRQRSPQTFERWLSGRIRSRWLTWFRYRRRWASVMGACSLTKSGGEAVQVPRLVSVRIGESLDTVRAKMLPGHSPADWENRAEQLAHAFGTRHAAAVIVGPALVELTFRRSDSLADPIVADFESVAGFKALPTRKAA
ncbi:hypothetical protein [Nocardia sp. NPDC050718]|uniref:hypothetical protein n=1 Tax=Nocardia sp. NPDC050718 TaxID=3155788 RepID=UPI0033CF62B1